MNTSPIDRFLKDLRESAVVQEDALEPYLHSIRGGDPKALALAMVQAGLLTDWQAKYLLSGRSRLRIGNYLLLERFRRDELGDGFLALHEPLQRRVHLQILPEQLTRQSSGFAALTSLVGRLTSLDHPRVEHVYDLGEESGRLFVVYEKSLGRILDSRMAGALTEGEAAGAMQGIASGLAYLQSRGIGHGALAAGGLLLSKDGEGKIVGLCDALLRRALEGNELLSPEELLSVDRRQWKEFADRLLARHFRRPEFSAWATQLEKSLEQPECLESFANQIGAWRKELSVAIGASDLDLPTGRAAGGQPLPLSAERAAKERLGSSSQAAKPTGSPADKSRSSTGTDWRKLYLAGLSALVIIGLCGFGVWKFWFGSKSPPPRVASVERSSDKVASPAPESQDRQLPKKARQAVGLMEQPVSSGAEEPQMPSPDRLEESPVEPLVAEPMAQQPPELREKRPSESEKGDSLVAQPSEIRKDAGALNQEGNRSSDTSGKKSSVEPAPLPPADDSPLKSFPKVVSLGQPGAGAVTLGPVAKLTFEELQLRLAYDPETVARSKTFFEFQPVAERSAWKVLNKKRVEDAESETVGEFRLADGQLQFTWAEGLEPRSVGLNLCNCALELESSGGTSCITKLREPVLFEGFALDDKKLTAQTSLELSALPHADSLKIVFGPFSADGPWAEAMVVNPDFDERQPAVLVFRPLESEQLCGLTVQRQLRGRIELAAAWAVRQQDKWQPLKQIEFKKTVDAMAQAYAQSVVQSDLAARAIETAVRGTKGKTEDAAKAAKKLSLEIGKQNELMGVHAEILNRIQGQEIPLRLVYQTAGRELILAETAAAREAAAAAAAAAANPPDEKAEEAKKKK